MDVVSGMTWQPAARSGRRREAALRSCAMSDHDDDPPPAPDDEPAQDSGPRRRRLSSDDKSALSWLARWIGLPLLLVIAVFYAEPLFRPRPNVEVVPTVTRQEVHPYPFPPGAKLPPLAPPEVPREQKPEPPPPIDLTPPTSSEAIVANPIEQPSPEYPQRAVEAGKEGLVRLRITIAPDGTVTDAVVISARPPGWFENAAIRGVKRWRYQPPGRVLQTEVEIEFKLR